METAEEKYKIIEEMISRDNNLLNITKLCEIAEVSRSGFYNWKNNHNKRQQKEQQDKEDFNLILQAYQYRGYDKGGKKYPHDSAAYGNKNEYQENKETHEEIWTFLRDKKSQSI